MKTPKEVAKYIVETIREETDDTLDETIVLGIVGEIMYDAFSDMLTDADIDIVDAHEEDADFFWNYCAEKIPNYYTVLEEIAADIITEYMVPEDEQKNED